jgi:putative transposase
MTRGSTYRAVQFLGSISDENRRLKKMYAEERLKAEMVTEALAKKW